MNLRESVLATIAYHDIFDYPLKVEEINKFLIENSQDSSRLEKTLNQLIYERKIGEHKGWFFLKNRKPIVSLRLKRTRYSKAKLKKAKIFASILSLIPTVYMVGISGALAMENSHPEDDIDLVVITSANLLWTTRLFANVLLFPVKRKAGTNISNNRACLNLFIDESDLKIKDENIYQAHEICQLKPLWQRDNAYDNFIKANRWVKKYLPNWKPQSINNQQSTINNKKNRGVNSKFSILNFQLSIFESLFKKLQFMYMRRKVTTERIGKHQLFFHPSNTQERVLKEYERRIKKLI